jgi:serine/threonine protein phosphatase PrpC
VLGRGCGPPLTSAAVIAQDVLEELSSLHHGSNEEERRRIASVGGTMRYDRFDRVWRVEGVLAVTRAIGDASLKPFVTASPQIKEVEVRAGDLVLFASDGLWDEVGRDKVAQSLRQGQLELLVASIAKTGEDNITTMLIDVAKAVRALLPGDGGGSGAQAGLEEEETQASAGSAAANTQQEEEKVVE